MMVRNHIAGVILLFGFFSAAAGCRPVPERLAEGHALMGAGEYPAAAEYFLAVLEENPEDNRARAHAYEAGNRAITHMLLQADAASDVRDYDEAVNLFLEIDALRSRAFSQGVSLQPPVDYRERRRDAFDRKIAVLTARGRDYAEAGQWEDALRTYERIADELEPDDAQEEQTLTRRARVLMDWARAEYEAGRYRTARDVALRAKEAAAIDPALAEQAENLRLMIENEGSRRIALIPVIINDAEDAVLRAALAAVSEYAAIDTVAFTTIVDPDAVRRELRRIRPAREALTEDNLVEIGLAVDADYLVLAERKGIDEPVLSMALDLQVFGVHRGAMIDTGNFSYRPIDAMLEDARIEADWESGAEVARIEKRNRHDRAELIGYAEALRKMILGRIALEVE